VNDQSGGCTGIISPQAKLDIVVEKEDLMTRKLAMATALAVIALTSAVGVGTTEAHGFSGGGFHSGGGGFHGGFGSSSGGFGAGRGSFGGVRGGFGRDGRFSGRGFYGLGFAPNYGYGNYYSPGCYRYGYAPYGCYGGYGY
jgi:hypothetical protein